MSLFFNMLSRLVITFLPRSKHLLISWLQSPSAVILESPKMKSATVSFISPSIYHEVMGPCPETEMSSGTGLSTCLTGLTSTHRPTFHPLVTRVSEIPFFWILSLLPPFHVLALGGRIPMALGLSVLFPIWLWNRGHPCQSRQLLLSEKVLRTGMPSLLAFSCPCVTSLFSCNRTFSIPALKIFFRMPSSRSISPGLPRGDKTKKTYLLF